MSASSSKLAASQNSGRRRRLPVKRKAVYAIFSLTIFAVVLESTLKLCGVTPVVEKEDPYVGFSSWIPLYQKNDDGHYGTARNKLTFFNAQQFAVDDQDQTTRIFTVGGSTTYGRPYNDATSFSGWLRVLLPRADNTQHWEVINAGGISYASYRVTKVMEEISDYHPDVFIIYCGHNEFLEHRTYSKLKGSSLLTALGSAAGQTRTFALIHRAWNHAVPHETSSFHNRELLPTEVVTLLDGSVGPQEYQRDEELREHILQHYEINLRRMVAIANDAGARVLLIVPASNVRDSSPFKSQHSAFISGEQEYQFAEHLSAAKRLQAGGESLLAVQQLDAALEIDAGVALAHYLRGQALYELGEFDQARDAFSRAVSEDICPLRILPEMQEAVRRVAADFHVPVVDFATVAESAAENHIPGRDLFLDHVHPTIRGNRMLALAIVDSLSAAGQISLSDQWGEDAIAEETRRLEAGLDQESHGIALRNLSRVLGWAGKIDEARQLALDAVKLAPLDAETQFQAGIAMEGAERLEKAEEHYRRAGELDPEFEAVHVNRGVVLGKLERFDEAEQEFREALRSQPDSPSLLANLAMLFALQNDYPAAILHQEQALKHASDDQRADIARRLRRYRNGTY